MSDLLCRIAQNGRDAAGVTICVDESWPLDTIVALPFDGEAGIGLLQVDRFGVSPIAASTTNPTQYADQTANWKLPITRPTRPCQEIVDLLAAA